MAEVVAGILAWVIPALVVFGVTAIADRGDRLGGPRGAALAACAGGRGRPIRAQAGVDPRAARRRRRRTRPRGRPLGRALRRRCTGIPPPCPADRAARARRIVRGVPRDLRRRTPRPSRSGGSRRASSGAAPKRSRRSPRRAPSTPAGCGRTCRRRRRSPPRASASTRCARRWATRRRSSRSCPSRFAEDEWSDAVARRARGRRQRRRGRAVASRSRRRPPTTRPAPRSPTSPPAERALRRAEAEARTLEETHRLVTQAAQAVPGEFAAARTALRQAVRDARAARVRRRGPARRRAAGRSRPS